MSSDRVVIQARGLGKCYQIYGRPQDRLKQSLWLGRKRFYHEFWALRGVSFEARAGEAIGIIGRNGSGKSTLLQIIAGTLMPAEGDLHVEGTVAALLELGTGFNPEFTGIENVFMNGAILGLSRARIEKQLDQVLSFADIGDFVHQPVKTYSSGMLLRLAFSVQAFLEPDILIVDEALAVGDVYFQHKCMRQIKALLDRGTTLLFVTHATDTVKRFCSRGLWLEGGEARFFGSSGVAVEKYLAFMRMKEGGEAEAEAAAKEDAPDAAPATGEPGLSVSSDLLPLVSHEVDLTDERLFLRGVWQWAPSSVPPLLARCTRDPAALAGFRFSGDGLELDFLRSAGGGAIGVTVDGRERRFELSDANERRVERVRLVTPPGEHTVRIAPLARGARAGTDLVWMGGRAAAAQPPLAFRRDSAFGKAHSEVERYGNGKGRLVAVELLDYATAEPVTEVSVGQRLRLRLHAERLGPAGPRLEFSFVVRDRSRIDLFGSTTIAEGIRLDPDATRFVAEFAFDARLGPGSYSILAAFVEHSEDLSTRVPMDQVDIAAVFNVAFNPLHPVWYLFDMPIAVSAAVSGRDDKTSPGVDR